MAQGIGPVRSASEVLLMWEHVTDGETLQSASVRTAVFLSKVHDVPADVMEALDALVTGFCASGAAIHAVVRHLRDLERLERMTGP